MSKAIYMWGFKPNERSSIPMRYIQSNSRLLAPVLYTPKEFEPILDNYINAKEIWDKIPTWISKADLGRLILVHYFGGFYLDADAIIARNFLPEIKKDQLILFTESVLDSTDRLGPREDKSTDSVVRVANYAFGSISPGHPFLLDVINESIRRINIILEEMKTGYQFTHHDILWMAGPDVITTIYHQNKNKYTNLKLFNTDYVSNVGWGSWLRE